MFIEEDPLVKTLALSLLSTVLAFLPSTSRADQMCAGGSVAEVRSAPGGSQIGSVMPYGCVTTGEKRDIWVKVSLEGWVDEAELKVKQSGKSGEVGSAVAPKPAGDPLQLADFDVAVGNRDLQGVPSRVQLTLKVKNITPVLVNGWAALLAAQDDQGRVLFRYRVSDEAPIAPGAVKEVSYYWEKGEEPFDALSGTPKEKLKFSLHKIELRR
jgi:hypothetical protein